MSKKLIPIQDLSFFTNSGLFPIDQSSHSLNFVTCTQETSPFWLIRTLLASSLSQTKQASQEDSGKPEKPTHVVLVSCFDRLSMYSRSLLRQRIQFPTSNNPSSSNFSYVNLSKYLLPQPLSSSENLLTKILNDIKAHIPIKSSKNTLLIFESPDFLLSLFDSNTQDNTESGVNSVSLLRLISSIEKLVNTMYVFTNGDEEFLASSSSYQSSQTAGISMFGLPQTVESLEYPNEHTSFLSGLAHKSTALISMRPLSTGRADDVTGTLTIAQGPRARPGQINSQSYHYYVNDDNIKIFYR